MSTQPDQDRRLEIRTLTLDDYAAVVHIQTECFPGVLPWTKASFSRQLEVFSEGQVGILIDGELVATSSSLLVTGDDWERDHSFTEVTDGGTIKGHEPDGDTLYGIDIAVLPSFRGWRLARRLYEYRKELIRQWNLRRMVIAGRIPGLSEHPEFTPEEYVRKVVAKEHIDSTLTAQLANGFYIQRVIRGYLPSDVESRGCAVLMEWLNPEWHPYDATAKQGCRVAAVQYEMRAVGSFEEFEQQCAFYADLASDYRADFLLYPELLTNQLIPLVEPDRPAMRVRSLDAYTERYTAMFSGLALKHNLNIIGGTHLVLEGDVLYNVAYLFHRDGRIDKQYKIHITPAESRWWGVSAGDDVEVFDTDCGKIAILICYDVEFPELARIARAKGAGVFFVPYNTDLRSAHMRVRTCAAARAIENNVYVVLSGMSGGLPHTEWAEMHYARSAILTPSDIPFPRDGIAAEANDNGGTLLLHDLDFTIIRKMQRQGSVRTWIDRRTDLYKLTWNEENGEKHEI
jgi:predicted amidohydrolase/ribosomal protein S18 acetylase RimI-like enzyme